MIRAFLASLFLCLALTGGPASVSAQQATDWNKVFTRMPSGSVRIGNPSAKITLVEYGARTCPHCLLFHMEGMPEIRSEWIASGKLNYEFRDYPIHPHDPAAALLGRCASDGGFYRVLDAFFEHQDEFNDRAEQVPQARIDALEKAPLSTISKFWSDTLGYGTLMKSLGMSQQRIDACLASRANLTSYSNMLTEAGKLGIGTTPSFVLNGKLLVGIHSWTVLRPSLKAAGG